MITNDMLLGRRLSEELYEEIKADIHKKSINSRFVALNEDEIFEFRLYSSNPEYNILRETITIDFTENYRFKLSLTRCYDPCNSYYHRVVIEAIPHVDDCNDDTWLKDYFRNISGNLKKLSCHIPSLEQFNLYSITNNTEISFYDDNEAKEYIEMLGKAYISKRYRFSDITATTNIFDTNDKKQQSQNGFDLNMRNNSIKFRRESNKVILYSILRYSKLYYFDEKGIKKLPKVLSDSNSYRREIFIKCLDSVYGQADFHSKETVIELINNSDFRKKKRQKLHELVEETSRLDNLQEAIQLLEAKYSYQTVHGLLKIMLHKLSVNPVYVPKSYNSYVLYNPLKLIHAMEVEKNNKKKGNDLH